MNRWDKSTVREQSEDELYQALRKACLYGVIYHRVLPPGWNICKLSEHEKPSPSDQLKSVSRVDLKRLEPDGTEVAHKRPRALKDSSPTLLKVAMFMLLRKSTGLHCVGVSTRSCVGQLSPTPLHSQCHWHRTCPADA